MTIPNTEELIEIQIRQQQERELKKQQIAKLKPFWCPREKVSCKSCMYNKRCVYTREGMKYQGKIITKQTTL